MVDWVWISGVLIFVALMCFCIVLLAHGTKQSATTQITAMLAPAPAASSLSRSQRNPEAPAQSATIMTQRESHYIAFISSSTDPSSKLRSPPIQRDATDELANTNPGSAKAIRGKRRNLAATSYALTDVDVKRRLIELWHRSLARTEKPQSWSQFSKLDRKKKAALISRKQP